MEKLKKLLFNIDEISTRLIKNDESVYSDIEKMFPAVSEAMDVCLKNIAVVNQAGYNIDENHVLYIVDSFASGFGKKDNLLLIDIMCFEIYSIVNILVNANLG